ncbi:DUF2182 domain-containing protein [Zooshikella sp. RANM57]|uniref:copper chaperone n=1 Tax=Zooshikella sp. RANM57 TaxID=3425863 RepID=UPI003D6E3D07
MAIAGIHNHHYWQDNPHWRFIFISLVVWLWLVLPSFVTEVSHHTTHSHTTDSAFNSHLLRIWHWQLMVLAMMLPLMSSALRFVVYALPRYRRERSIFSFLLGYLFIWSLAGVVVELFDGLMLHTVFFTDFYRQLLGAVGFLAAGLWCFSYHRRKAMLSCGIGMPLRINGWRAYLDCIHYGLKMGLRCLSSCWHIMAALVIAGHSLILMAIFTVLLIYERACLPAETKVLSYICILMSLLLTLKFLWFSI